MVIFDDVISARGELAKVKNVILKAEAICAESSIVEDSVRKYVAEQLSEDFDVSLDWKDRNNKVYSAVNLNRTKEGGYSLWVRLLSDKFQSEIVDKVDNHIANLSVNFRLEVRYGADGTFENILLMIMIVEIREYTPESDGKNPMYLIYNPVAEQYGNNLEEYIDKCLEKVKYSMRKDETQGKWIVEKSVITLSMR